MTTEILSRLQFAFTISFHILFPAFTIGLAGFLVLFEIQWRRTKNNLYLSLYQFWSKIFALSFGMGVVTGLVLSFEIGTNFSGFTKAAGNVVGPLLAYEVLMAFFLEAGFLGIMLFGLKKVGPRLHLLATIMVAVGTILSAFWIVSVNSWMQFPTGHTIKDGVFYVSNWMDVIFNPTFVLRLAHAILASYLTASFLILGISAFYLLKKKYIDFATTGLKIALWSALILMPTQILVGDLHGLKTLEYQPMKVAAMEGLWDTKAGAPLLLFAVPDSTQEKNHFEISIPNGASLLLTHKADGVVKGLKEVPPQDRPMVSVVFYSFRIMIGCGLLMLAIALYGVYKRLRRHDMPRGFLKLCVASIPLGFIATLTGWYVAEVGRQPWLIQGFLRIKDSISPLPASAVMTSLMLFIIVYNVLLFSFLFYAIKLIRKGPSADTKAAIPTDKPMSMRTPQGA